MASIFFPAPLTSLIERFVGDENPIMAVFYHGIIFAAMSLIFLGLLLLRNGARTTKSVPVAAAGSTRTTPKKSRDRKAMCPFSKNSNFLVETAEHLPETPLDLFEDWVSSSTYTTKPLAARWLAAGRSGQDTPGLLRAGLRRLRNSKHFLVVEPHRIRDELILKRNALDDPKRHPKLCVAEPSSLDAQRECLELFLDYLPTRYPELYTYSVTERTLYVQPIDTTFSIDEWWDTRPLELCNRIVQEDLILMRPGPSIHDDHTKNRHESYFMAAASVVFSFGEVPEKLGQPAEFIHAPVPGFEAQVRKTLNMSFSRLTPEQPMWRNNWGISPSGKLDEPLYGSTSAQEERSFAKISREEIKAKFLKVEYQTIRRFPRTRNLLFTVKTMVDPLGSLEVVPDAAVCLANSIRGMTSPMRIYKGIQDDATAEAVLAYLDSVSTTVETVYK